MHWNYWLIIRKIVFFFEMRKWFYSLNRTIVVLVNTLLTQKNYYWTNKKECIQPNLSQLIQQLLEELSTMDKRRKSVSRRKSVAFLRSICCALLGTSRENYWLAPVGVGEVLQAGKAIATHVIDDIMLEMILYTFLQTMILLIMVLV